MNYEQSLAYVYSAKELGAKKHGLANIKDLLKRLGNPEALFPSAHVAGTNGKGSTCAFLESIFRAAGYSTGLYTSPYLERFTERIRVNGREIAPDDFAALATGLRPVAEAMAEEGLRPTFFELVTACCFLHFAQAQPDLAVIETGLGGRTDATNVLTPAVSVITSIGIDHAHVLGGTLESIAEEKAGIIKPGVPVILEAGNPPEVAQIIRRRAEELGAPFTLGDDYTVTTRESDMDGQTFDLEGPSLSYKGLRISLLGGYQLKNAATALLAALSLRSRYDLPDQAIYDGLAQARWPGRMEVLRRQPLIVIDGAHNPQGAQALAGCLQPLLGGQRACFVMGSMAEKDVAPMVQWLAPLASRVFATCPPTSRHLHAPEEVAGLFQQLGVSAQACPDWQQALEQAVRQDMPLVVTGSLYLAGAARTWLREQGYTPSPSCEVGAGVGAPSGAGVMPSSSGTSTSTT